MAGAYYKRELSGRVRDKTLRLIEIALDDEKCKKHTKEFRQQLLLRLAGSVLPRIQEHTGEDGEPLQIKVFYANERNTPPQMANSSDSSTTKI